MSDPRDYGLDTGRAGAVETASMADPLAIIERQHGLQEGLCDLLENIADGLPNEIDRADVSAAITYLGDELPLLQRNENDGLFPLLLQRCQPEDMVERSLDKLTQEHAADLSFAGDVAEALREIERGGPAKNAEMLGYMLRSFFESYRRHLFWERMVILPMARKRLTADDLAELSRRLQTHRREQNEGALRSTAAPRVDRTCYCQSDGDDAPADARDGDGDGGDRDPDLA